MNNVPASTDVTHRTKVLIYYVNTAINNKCTQSERKGLTLIFLTRQERQASLTLSRLCLLSSDDCDLDNVARSERQDWLGNLPATGHTL